MNNKAITRPIDTVLGLKKIVLLNLKALYKILEIGAK
jgi:hypothetical protein